MDESKKTKIIEAAIRVFGEKGYQYATISEIASQADISTGLLYSYFKNKLDVLLSIILMFLKQINIFNNEKLKLSETPLEKIYIILNNFENLLIKDNNALYMVKVLNEALPHLVMIKEKSLQEKRIEIMTENKKLIDTIDKIISEGQNLGVFENSLNPSVMRQVLCGAIERVIYGLFFTTCSGQDIGYNQDDAHKSIVKLIEKFITV